MVEKEIDNLEIDRTAEVKGEKIDKNEGEIIKNETNID